MTPFAKLQVVGVVTSKVTGRPELAMTDIGTLLPDVIDPEKVGINVWVLGPIDTA